jgi:signal transduction histidine kinase
MTGGAKARSAMGVPAAFAAVWAVVPLAWNGLPGSAPRDAALAAAALALSAAVALAAAALVRRLLCDGSAKAFAAIFALVSAGGAFVSLGAAGRLAGVGARAWPEIYGLSAAFMSLASLVPLHLWARASTPPASVAARPLGGALFEWLAVSAAIVALPLADRAAHLAGGSAGATPALVAQVLVAVGIAAAVAAIVSSRARLGVAPRIAGIDGVPDEAPALPPARFAAEVACLDREIARLGESYVEALASQGALIEERRKTRERKAKVFASMSHDLRGPLNSIVGFSDLLLKGIDGELSERQRATVVEISREAERLLVLTGDILDTAKMDAGRFDLERVWVPTVELLTACEEGAGRFVAAKGIRFRTALKPGLPPVLVDKERIVGVLLGLVSRAADAMEGGSLLLLARQVSSLEEGRDYVLFELVDEEGRADPAWRGRAFDVFASLAGVTIPGENGGLALGIALVERILRLHDGELAVGAEAGEPVFTVALPLDRAENEG